MVCCLCVVFVLCVPLLVALFVVCCLLFVVCCLLFVVCCLGCLVVGCWVFVVCRSVCCVCLNVEWFVCLVFL